MKKLFGIIIYSFLFVSSSYASETVNLNCKLGNSYFEILLDYKKSQLKFLGDENANHMIYDDKIIKTSTPGNVTMSHYLWEISRLTGRGIIKMYKISDEEIETVKQSYVAEILLSNVGNLEDKSLDSKRNEIIIKYLVPFLQSQEPKQINEFECEKTEVKF